MQTSEICPLSKMPSSLAICRGFPVLLALRTSALPWIQSKGQLVPAQGGEAWAVALLLPGSLGRTVFVGLCEARREVISSFGMHRQIIHLGLFLDYLQLLYIKTWVGFLMSISLPVLGCHSYFHSNLLRQKKKSWTEGLFLCFCLLLFYIYFLVLNKNT